MDSMAQRIKRVNVTECVGHSTHTQANSYVCAIQAPLSAGPPLLVYLKQLYLESQLSFTQLPGLCMMGENLFPRCKCVCCVCVGCRAPGGAVSSLNSPTPYSLRGHRCPALRTQGQEPRVVVLRTHSVLLLVLCSIDLTLYLSFLKFKM